MEEEGDVGWVFSVLGLVVFIFWYCGDKPLRWVVVGVVVLLANFVLDELEESKCKDRYEGSWSDHV